MYYSCSSASDRIGVVDGNGDEDDDDSLDREAEPCDGAPGDFSAIATPDEP